MPIGVFTLENPLNYLEGGHTTDNDGQLGQGAVGSGVVTVARVVVTVAVTVVVGWVAMVVAMVVLVFNK